MVRLIHRRRHGVAAESAARAVRVGELRTGEREARAKLLSELARRELLAVEIDLPLEVAAARIKVD